jgi:hypothetical protein
MLKDKNLFTMPNLKHYRPFYYFSTPSRLNILDKSTLIRVNGVSYYKIK